MSYDAIVIGSGAGGAPVAKELAEAGMRVVLLEEGPRFDASELTARPRDMVARLYRDAGQTTTLGNPPIVLPLGRAVGGSTFVNSGTCFRVPATFRSAGATSSAWRASGRSLDDAYARVGADHRRLRGSPEIAGRNALIAQRGAAALGWSGGFLRPQRARLRRLGRVRVRVPARRQAAHGARPTCRSRRRPARRSSRSRTSAGY